MKIKGVIDEDFVNYKKPSMVIMCPVCSFKCDKECGRQVCQNGTLATAPDIEINELDLAIRFVCNPITEAVVFAGLEPFDSFDSVFLVAFYLRLMGFIGDIVIYTGYTEEEVAKMSNTINKKYLDQINEYLNPCVIKYGRFIPDQNPHYDEVLGVKLASDNQYAVRYE